MSKAKKLNDRKLELIAQLEAVDNEIQEAQKKEAQKIAELFFKADAVDVDMGLVAGAIVLIQEAASNEETFNILESACERAKFFRGKIKRPSSFETASIPTGDT